MVSDGETLKVDEVHALCAYLLSIDAIVPKTAVLDVKNLPKVKMPNRNGFKDMWDQHN